MMGKRHFRDCCHVPNGAACHSASSPQNKVRRWLDGWRKVRRGTFGFAISGSTQSRTLGDGRALGGAIRVPWHAALGGGAFASDGTPPTLVSCLFALERSHGPGGNKWTIPKRNWIMHSPGVPFRRSVLHYRGTKRSLISGRSDMFFSPLPCRLNGLTLSIDGHVCWEQMRQCQTQIVHFSSQAEPTHGAGSINQCRAKKLVGSLSAHEASLSCLISPGTQRSALPVPESQSQSSGGAVAPPTATRASNEALAARGVKGQLF